MWLKCIKNMVKTNNCKISRHTVTQNNDSLHLAQDWQHKVFFFIQIFYKQRLVYLYVIQIPINVRWTPWLHKRSKASYWACRREHTTRFFLTLYRGGSKNGELENIKTEKLLCQNKIEPTRTERASLRKDYGTVVTITEQAIIPKAQMTRFPFLPTCRLSRGGVGSLLVSSIASTGGKIQIPTIEYSVATKLD